MKASYSLKITTLFFCTLIQAATYLHHLRAYKSLKRLKSTSQFSDNLPHIPLLGVFIDSSYRYVLEIGTDNYLNPVVAPKVPHFITLSYVSYQATRCINFYSVWWKMARFISQKLFLIYLRVRGSDQYKWTKIVISSRETCLLRKPN